MAFLSLFVMVSLARAEPSQTDIRLLYRAKHHQLTTSDVWLRADDALGERALAALGHSGKRLERWVQMRLDAAQLTIPLGAQNHVSLELSPAHFPQGRLSRREIGITKALVQGALRGRREGQGVLIGLVDTGIDLSHEAFFDAHKMSRVVAVWDQDRTSATPPAAFGYGTLCDAHTIARGTCSLDDEVGHGTHVAAIAAGRHAEAGGVAPAADIAMVRSRAFTRLADAVRFLLDLGAARGQPTVVNISVGGHYGPHDGQSSLERELTRLTGPGRILVAAAGNDGNASIHARLSLESRPLHLGLANLPNRMRPGLVVVDLWSEGANRAAVTEVALEIWQGNLLLASASLPPVTLDLTPELLFLPGASSPFGAALFRTHQSQDGRTHVEFLFDGARQEPLPEGLNLALRLQGEGVFNAWFVTDHQAGTLPRFLSSQLPADFVPGNSDSSIVVPATSAGVITVGSTTVQTLWQSLVGRQSLLHETLGFPSSFTARGPTGAPHLTGPKPDLLAPGGVVVSARAAHSLPHPNELISKDAMVMQGTSMAAPHVTGAVALMLEADPTLDPADVRRHLRDQAQSPSLRCEMLDSGACAPDAKLLWGAGTLDAAASVRAVEAEANGCQAGHSDSGLSILIALLALCKSRCLRSALLA